MSFLVKRLFKINLSLNTSVLIFFAMRVGPVRVTVYNERAVAQVDIRKIPRVLLFRTRNQTNSRILKQEALPLRRKPYSLHTVM